MSSFINIEDASYSILNSYAALASAGMTATATTTITNGNYGSSPTATYTGPFIGTQDDANASTAQTQLTDLVTAINNLGSGTTITGTTSNEVKTYTPGIYSSASTLIFSSGSTITLDAQNDTNAQFFFIAGSAITFASVSTITLINSASTCNVFWLAGSAISFTGTSPVGGIPGIFIANTAISFANASNISGRVYSQTAAITFVGPSSVDGACLVVCYAKGSLILTKHGFVPIENIKEGDEVVTNGKIYNNSKFIPTDGKLKLGPVVWISKFKVKYLDSKSRPICIKKDAFGENKPFKDLYVSPGHRLLLNGEMVQVSKIINGISIHQDNECNKVEYYHLECVNHCAIVANGILAESYLDVDNNRCVFESSRKLLHR